MVNAEAIENWLAARVAGALNISWETVDTRLPFMALGLSSLDLLSLTGELSGWLGRNLDAPLFWEFPTIEAVARHLSLSSAESPGASQGQPLPLTPVQEGILRHAQRALPTVLSPAFPGTKFVVPLRLEGSKTPLFIVPGGWGGQNEVLIFATMLEFMETDRPVYAVQSRAMDATWSLPARLEDQSEAVFREIQLIQPAGPYLILGECAAGVMAAALASQAERLGQPPGLLLLLDAPPPPKDSSGAKSGTAGRDREESAESRGAPALPDRITAYYSMLAQWESPVLQSALHLVLSSGGYVPDKAIAQCHPCSTTAFRVHRVPGDHNSYIREHAADTARVLTGILEAVK